MGKGRKNTKRRRRGKGKSTPAAPTGNSFEKLLRDAVHEALERGDTIVQIDELANQMVLRQGGTVARQGRQEIRKKLGAIIAEEYVKLKDIDQRVLDAKRKAILEGKSPEEIEAEEARLRELAQRYQRAQEELREVESTVRDLQRSWLISNSSEVYRPSHREKPQENTVEAYMEALANAFQLTRQADPSQKRDAVYLWHCFREARVFHFDPDVYGGVYQEIDRYTTEDLAGLDFYPAKEPTTEESARLREVVFRESRFVPYPEKFPFPCVFLGYGNGIGMPLETLKAEAPKRLRDHLDQGAISGHLLTDEGYVVAVYRAILRDDEGYSGVLWFNHFRDPTGGWVRSEVNLEPWILPHLIGIINDHRTFIVETPLTPIMRQEYKEHRKRMGVKPDKYGYTPPPYYSLRLNSKLIREKVRRNLPKPVCPPSYRTDVRAHERCRVMRGPLPIDPKLAAMLNKRHYKIFTTNDLDDDTLRRLYERGVAFKRSDEWLAILTSWVSEHYTSNNEELPYIPACRVPGQVRIKPRQPSRSWRDDPASTGALP